MTQQQNTVSNGELKGYESGKKEKKHTTLINIQKYEKTN